MSPYPVLSYAMSQALFLGCTNICMIGYTSTVLITYSKITSCNMYAYFTVEHRWNVHETNRLYIYHIRMRRAHDAQALLRVFSSGSTKGSLVPSAYVFCWQRLLVSCRGILVWRVDAGLS